MCCWLLPSLTAALPFAAAAASLSKSFSDEFSVKNPGLKKGLAGSRVKPQGLLPANVGPTPRQPKVSLQNTPSWVVEKKSRPPLSRTAAAAGEILPTCQKICRTSRLKTCEHGELISFKIFLLISFKSRQQVSFVIITFFQNPYS